MKKINYLFIIFVLFLFVSCKSKKNVVSILPRPVLNVDSVRPDSSAAIDGLFAPDHSQLADLKVSTKKQKKTAKKEAATEQEERNLVLRGTKITSSTVNVPATYSGIDRVVEYHFRLALQESAERERLEQPCRSFDRPETGRLADGRRLSGRL